MATTLDFASPGPVTRSYRLVVHQYGFMKEQCRNGQPIEFPPFKAGDCSWCIYYYPNGRSTSSADYISIFIAGAGGRAVTDEPVKARVSFSLLDRAGEPVPGHSCSGVWEYSKLDWYGCDLFIHKESLEALEYLVDDRLTIECVVSVERAYDLQQRLSLDPDVTFQVGGEAFSVHRCVLAAKSPVLEAELARESTLAAWACCIHIDDMLPQVFKSVLHFVYTDSLPEMTTGPEEESIMAEHLLVAADRFDMQELKLICEEILSSDINVNTVTKTLGLAVQHHCHMLRDACIEFLGDPPVLEAVMATDHDILELVAKNCPMLLKEMWAYEDDPMQDELAMCF
jgi:speckle-type POZ protein